MGKAAVLTVLSFMLAGSYYAFGTQQNLTEAQNRISEHQMDVLARNAALAGHSRAQQLLADSFSGQSGGGQHEGVRYDYAVSTSSLSPTVLNPPIGTVTETAEIEVVGTYEQPGSDPVTYTIRSKYAKTKTLPGSPPPHMGGGNVLLTDDDLDVRGNVQSKATYADGESGDRLNSNMHTNGDLIIKGKSVDVMGFGTYAGNLDAQQSHADAAFTPNDNPNDTTTTQRVDPIDIPAFDSEDTINEFGGADMESGDVTLSGDYDFTARGSGNRGTREKPYIWHVEGDLTLGGDTNLNGYVVFVVDGESSDEKSIHMNNGSLRTSTDNGESNAAFYTGRGIDFKMTGGVEVHGQFFAGKDSELDMVGNSSLYGSFTTAGSALLRGTPQLYYRPPSPALTKNWQELSEEVLLAEHHAW
jgi:hypothetical protein